jgi:hypothetical protein
LDKNHCSAGEHQKALTLPFAKNVAHLPNVQPSRFRKGLAQEQPKADSATYRFDTAP